jgi:hypothetical protein
MIHSLTGARTSLALAALAALAACGSDTEVTIGSGDYAVNTRPAFLVGAVRSANGSRCRNWTRCAPTCCW